ncbi:MAG: FAD-dependent oxidoreductase, partial [Promethearchaeota archaeon]
MDDKELYDLIIVGGGPGGLSCAIHAAKLGMQVLVLERGSEIGDKNASGCALSPKCWRDLPLMEDFLQDVPHRVGKVAAMHFIDEHREELGSFSASVSKRFASYDAARQFLTINVYRRDLDQWLAGKAVENNAIIKTGSLVTRIRFSKDRDERGFLIHEVEVNHEVKYHAPLVIGADGVFSIVCREAGIREKWSNDDLALLITLDFESSREKIDEFIGGASLHYYYGANFPIGYVFFTVDGFHVGLGHYINWFIKEGIAPIACLEEFISVPAIQRVMKILDAKPREFQAHCVPFVEKPYPLHGDGYMILGDAAGLICPLEAEGVYYAMLAGKIAAEIAHDAKIKVDYSSQFLKRYDLAIEKSPIGEEFRYGKKWKRFIDMGPFNLDISNFLVNLPSDLMFTALNVAEPHSETIEKHAHGRIIELLRLLYPKLKNIAEPVLVSLLDEFLCYYFDKLKLTSFLNPIIKSTKSMRQKIIEYVLDDWLGDDIGYGEPEKNQTRLGDRISRISRLNLRRFVHVEMKHNGEQQMITHDKSRCINCARCALICP